MNELFNNKSMNEAVLSRLLNKFGISNFLLLIWDAICFLRNSIPENPGTVYSVGLTADPVFEVQNSPVTTTGTFDLRFANGKNPNLVLATPNGIPGPVALRGLNKADIPDLDITQITNLEDALANAGGVNGIISGGGVYVDDNGDGTCTVNLDETVYLYRGIQYTVLQSSTQTSWPANQWTKIVTVAVDNTTDQSSAIFRIGQDGYDAIYTPVNYGPVFIIAAVILTKPYEPDADYTFSNGLTVEPGNAVRAGGYSDYDIDFTSQTKVRMFGNTTAEISAVQSAIMQIYDEFGGGYAQLNMPSYNEMVFAIGDSSGQWYRQRVTKYDGWDLIMGIIGQGNPATRVLIGNQNSSASSIAHFDGNGSIQALFDMRASDRYFQFLTGPFGNRCDVKFGVDPISSLSYIRADAARFYTPQGAYPTKDQATEYLFVVQGENLGVGGDYGFYTVPATEVGPTLALNQVLWGQGNRVPGQSPDLTWNNTSKIFQVNGAASYVGTGGASNPPLTASVGNVPLFTVAILQNFNVTNVNGYTTRTSLRTASLSAGQTANVNLNLDLPTESGTIALNEKVVHLTGNEAIAGAKTFSGDVRISGGTFALQSGTDRITFAAGSNFGALVRPAYTNGRMHYLQDMTGALAYLEQVPRYVLTTGPVNVYNFGIRSIETWPGHYNGETVHVRFHVLNTGASTLAFGVTGNIPLRKLDGTEFAAGELNTTQLYTFVYDSGVYYLTSATLPSSSGGDNFANADLTFDATHTHNGAQYNVLYENFQRYDIETVGGFYGYANWYVRTDDILYQGGGIRGEAQSDQLFSVYQQKGGQFFWELDDGYNSTVNYMNFGNSQFEVSIQSTSNNFSEIASAGNYSRGITEASTGYSCTITQYANQFQIYTNGAAGAYTIFRVEPTKISMVNLPVAVAPHQVVIAGDGSLSKQKVAHTIYYRYTDLPAAPATNVSLPPVYSVGDSFFVHAVATGNGTGQGISLNLNGVHIFDGPNNENIPTDPFEIKARFIMLSNTSLRIVGEYSILDGFAGVYAPRLKVDTVVTDVDFTSIQTLTFTAYTTNEIYNYIKVTYEPA